MVTHEVFDDETLPFEDLVYQCYKEGKPLQINGAIKQLIPPLADISISLDPEGAQQNRENEVIALDAFDARYRRDYTHFIDKHFGEDTLEIARYYDKYYNKMLPFVVEDFASIQGIPNSEVAGILVTQLFGVALVLDDIYDGSDQRFNQPAYHVIHGKDKTQQDVNNLLIKTAEVMATKFQPEISQKLMTGAHSGVELYRTNTKQDYTLENSFEAATSRWFVLNKGLFDLFATLQDPQMFHWFTNFSLGTHILNDLVDVSGQMEDFGSSQYNFAIALYSDLCDDKPGLAMIGNNPTHEQKVTLQKSMQEMGVDQLISQMSLDLLEKSLKILEGLNMQDSDHYKWTQARINRVKNGAYLIQKSDDLPALSAKY